MPIRYLDHEGLLQSDGRFLVCTLVTTLGSWRTMEIKDTEGYEYCAMGNNKVLIEGFWFYAAADVPPAVRQSLGYKSHVLSDHPDLLWLGQTIDEPLPDSERSKFELDRTFVYGDKASKCRLVNVQSPVVEKVLAQRRALIDPT
jgi:hypothetical protein